MKKLISVVVVLAVIVLSTTCLGAAAVYLNNKDVNGGYGQPVYFLTQSNLADEGFFIEILGGPDFNALSPIASDGPGHPAVFALHQGFFDGGIGNLPPSIPDNGPAYFQAVAWYGTNGVNGWHTARWVVWSASWSQLTGANTPPMAPTPAMLYFPSMAITTQGFPPISVPAQLQIVRYPRLLIRGTEGAVYRIEFSNVLPATNWVTLGYIGLPEVQYSLADTTATNGHQRFYRAMGFRGP